MEARNINVTFGFGPAAFNAVNHANVYVTPGEAVGIVGESGSGKTTLARVLVGLQRHRKAKCCWKAIRFLARRSNAIFRAGTLEGADGVPRPVLVPESASARDGRLWQKPSMFGKVCAAKRQKRKQSVCCARWALAWSRRNNFPKSLSGGQRQRVSVARALAPKPKILIADEPTSSIDQSAQAQLLNLLRQLQQEHGLAIVFISHDLGLVRYLTSRVYVMKKGDVVEQGDTVQVFDEPSNAYTRLLIGSIPGQKVEAWVKASKEAEHMAAKG